jgi:hypothetical protein
MDTARCRQKKAQAVIMFKSVDIENFRGFGKLALSDLGRVNLVVGKNNTGKTALLEAIGLLSDPGIVRSLPGLLRSPSQAVAARFYSWLLKDGAPMTLLSAKETGERKTMLALVRAQPGGLVQPPPHYGAHVSGAGDLYIFSSGAVTALPVHSVSVQHPLPDAMVDAFADAVRSPEQEKQMVELLQAVDDRVKSVRVDTAEGKPFIVVDVGLSKRVPLPQVGQGLYRLVTIFSELLGRKPKVCLIDEIENGIHHSAIADMWRGIAEVAERLDIQVFATTHSWECLVAAHEAFSSRATYDLRVIQLYRLAGDVSGRVLDAAHIKAAIAGEIELR